MRSWNLSGALNHKEKQKWQGLAGGRSAKADQRRGENKGQPVVQVKQETHGERPGSSQEERTCKLFRNCTVIKVWQCSHSVMSDSATLWTRACQAPLSMEFFSPGWMHETSAQGWCTGKTQRDGMGREVGEGIRMGTYVYPWLIHVNVWQKKPLQYCKVITLQLIKINEKKMQ